LGGTGGGIAYNVEELKELCAAGFEASPVHQLLIEESVLGWKEIEFEVMRDSRDNFIVVCTIENFDPMGIHTGDSITVAPAQTLTAREYARLRDASYKIIKKIGLQSGGCNLQYAVNPEDGRIIVIEMNPRVSRSSALASKATGFPIAKISTKLAVGYRLDELPNYITRKTTACFEPQLDYCVVKVPRFDFVKFAGVDQTLTTQMKSVGEVMSIGRTFKEALQKAMRSLEQDRYGLGADGKDKFTPWAMSQEEKAQLIGEMKKQLRIPTPERIFYLRYALELGITIDEIYQWTGIDPWFLYNLKQLLDLEAQLRTELPGLFGTQEGKLLLEAKRFGYSDQQLAFLAGKTEEEIRTWRQSLGIRPVYKLVDSCAGEFDAVTPYFYSTYEVENEARATGENTVIVLGGGPNRIGQGIEFDYCCVQAAKALKDAGKEVVMINCNPETVSTDYDISSRLYFEPLTLEDVLNICDLEKPEGVVLQFGGQTPLKLALDLERRGIPILGTSPEAIDLAEDREKFAKVLRDLKLKQPDNGMASSEEEAAQIASRIGYPVLVRPSYVLGGRAMEVVYDEDALRLYMEKAVKVTPDHPVLVDKFLESAIEVDVDAISDGEDCYVAGVMEHIELAGVHSGDSACSLPPFSLPDEIIGEIKRQTKLLGLALKVRGLLNIQFAVRDGEIYLLEVNPRASRTVPFVSKASGISIAQIATKIMLGHKLPEFDLKPPGKPRIAVKEAVFPFIKFPGVDIILGPEMRSTGEVMGIDDNFGMAFAKSQMSAGVPLPLSGTVLLTVADRDKEALLPIAHGFLEEGFKLLATAGTAQFLKEHGVRVEKVYKIGEGRPNILDRIKNAQIDLVVNTPVGKGPRTDEYKIRRQVIANNVSVMTTIQAAKAALAGIRSCKDNGLDVKSIQEYYRK
jgi:carbamoyl-phosphate synthase large subunit